VETDNTAIEHQNVPQSHQGLHGFLYSSEDEHTAGMANDSSPDITAAVMPLEDWCHLAGTAKVIGVYAVLGCDRRTHYVGYSRNVALSLKGHAAQLGKDICAFVQVQTFKLAKREVMEQQRDAWIAQLGHIPSGNAEASELWAGTVGEAAIAAMSPAERYAYEEKKLKLRKAMADSELSRDSSSESDTGQQTPGATVENGDWSAVIQEQTQQV
jgi:hypothetical protein